MNTDIETKQITEADVVEFLKQKATDLSRSVNVGYASVGIEVCHTGSVAIPFDVRCTAYAHGCTSQQADTSLAVAIESMVNAMSPDRVANAKREQAAKLLAEAEQLAPSK